MANAPVIFSAAGALGAITATAEILQGAIERRLRIAGIWPRVSP